MKSKVLYIVIAILLSLVTAKSAQAAELTSSELESPFYHIKAQKVDRVESLRAFFKSFDGPLEAYAETFVQVADKYGLDYRLLPSIACLESSCGKFYIPDSNNPFGWGIYGNKVTKFATMEDCIDAVGKGLSENYIKKGYDTVEKIAPIYNPPNPIKWAGNVNYFYNKIN